MAHRTSAGLMMYRRRGGKLEVLLVHPGGPFFKNKDLGTWTVPKGEPAEGEEPLATARREFQEETGIDPGDAPLIPLGEVKQKAGKVVHAWAFEGDCDIGALKCNTFKVQWPPRSGQWKSFPEVDQYGFFDLDAAREKINPAQVALLERLHAALRLGGRIS
jgi:predicted NUDIX family NTP pyrophosphohydrolase